MGRIPIYSLFVNELFYKVNFADLKKNAFSIYLDKIVPNWIIPTVHMTVILSIKNYNYYKCKLFNQWHECDVKTSQNAIVSVMVDYQRLKKNHTR